MLLRCLRAVLMEGQYWIVRHWAWKGMVEIRRRHDTHCGVRTTLIAAQRYFFSK